jgi:enterochelin esterase-like enzyme
MEDRYYRRTIVKHTISSRFLSEERNLRIFLPPGYSGNHAYPVVYCQDGLDFFMMGRIATIANALMLDKKIRPALLVGIDVDKSSRTSQYSPTGKKHTSYKYFFTQELVPSIDRHFSTEAHPQSRILAGVSLGGTVSLHLALDNPDTFSRVLSLSGAYQSPTIEALERASDLSGLMVYMRVGNQETDVKTERGSDDFLAWNRRVKAVLEQKGARIHYGERPGGHTWGFWQAMLPEALACFLGV